MHTRSRLSALWPLHATHTLGMELNGAVVIADGRANLSSGCVDLYLRHLADYHSYRTVFRAKAAMYLDVVFIPPARCASEAKPSFSASLLCQRDFSWSRREAHVRPGVAGCDVGKQHPAGKGSPQSMSSFPSLRCLAQRLSKLHTSCLKLRCAAIDTGVNALPLALRVLHTLKLLSAN